MAWCTADRYGLLPEAIEDIPLNGGVTVDRVERLKRRLIALRDEINAHHGQGRVAFNQQKKTQANMSFYGCNGRIWIQPAPEGCDVSLSGKSLEAQLTEPFNRLFRKASDRARK